MKNQTLLQYVHNFFPFFVMDFGKSPTKLLKVHFIHHNSLQHIGRFLVTGSGGLKRHQIWPFKLWFNIGWQSPWGKCENSNDSTRNGLFLLPLQSFRYLFKCVLFVEAFFGCQLVSVCRPYGPRSRTSSPHAQRHIGTATSRCINGFTGCTSATRSCEAQRRVTYKVGNRRASHLSDHPWDDCIFTYMNGWFLW